MTSVASNFLFFLFFWINRKTLTIHPFRQFFFFFFIEKWRRKVRSYEYFNGEERKNLIRIHYRLTNLVGLVIYTGSVDMWGDWGGEGGGRLSFRDADVVRSTFDLDFPEGLSCRESTVDESGGKALPYRLCN